MFDLPIDEKKIEHMVFIISQIDNYKEAFERKLYITVILLCSKSVKFFNKRNFLKIINLYSKTFYFLVKLTFLKQEDN